MVFCVSCEVASSYGIMGNVELAEIRVGDSALYSSIAGSRNSVKHQIDNFEDSSLHFVFYRLLSNDNGRLRFERHKYFVIKRKFDELEKSNWHLVLTDSMIPKEYLKSIADTASISLYRKQKSCFV